MKESSHFSRFSFFLYSKHQIELFSPDWCMEHVKLAGNAVARGDACRETRHNRSLPCTGFKR